MLALQGHDSALMFVAKNGMPPAHGSVLQRLQAAIATVAGLGQADHVQPGQVLRMVAELHDKLVAAGLLQRPAQGLLDSFRNAYTLSGTGPGPSAKDVFLEGMVSNITCMRIATDEAVRLVVWEQGLPTGFAEQAAKLLEDLVAPARKCAGQPA